MKVQFDIKYRPQIESGEYKVILENGHSGRVLAWNLPGDFPIAIADVDDTCVWVGCYDNKGWCGIGKRHNCLFIVTSEPELTEFEQEVRECVTKNLTTHIKYGNGMEMSNTVFIDDDTVKKMATELLKLAREELVKQGYVIEKKLFHDAVEKIDDRYKAEMSVEYSLHCKVENGTRHAVMNWNEFQKIAQHFIDCGKAEALKDLPRWKKWGNGAGGNGVGIPIALVRTSCGYKLTDCLGILGEKYIMLSELRKLPGFKED